MHEYGVVPVEGDIVGVLWNDKLDSLDMSFIEAVTCCILIYGETVQSIVK